MPPPEYIVAKAIRDGAIDAVIDHEGGFMWSRERTDVYSTTEPQAAFHARIAYCLDLHNDAIKAMRFEPDAHRWARGRARARPAGGPAAAATLLVWRAGQRAARVHARRVGMQAGCGRGRPSQAPGQATVVLVASQAAGLHRWL
jgi:hypothetical protein